MMAGYNIEDIKKFEAVSTSRRAEKGLPLVVRLDGRAFHTFTRGLVKRPGKNNNSESPLPFHQGLSDLMVETMKYLVEELHPRIAYTQSDEITLILLTEPDRPEEQMIFDGRFQKIESISASIATAFFNKNLAKFVPEKESQMPVFDSRAFTVPDLKEALHVLLWRQQDATRNAASSAARLIFSQNQLFKKSSREMKEMLSSRFQINFEDYPYRFKRGVFARRVPYLVEPSEMTDVPEKYRPINPVIRSRVETFDVDLVNIENPIDVLFSKKSVIL